MEGSLGGPFRGGRSGSEVLWRIPRSCGGFSDLVVGSPVSVVCFPLLRWFPIGAVGFSTVRWVLAA